MRTLLGIAWVAFILYAIDLSGGVEKLLHPLGTVI